MSSTTLSSMNMKVSAPKSTLSVAVAQSSYDGGGDASKANITSGSGNGTLSPTHEQVGNPLWNVSSEYMRASGYTTPFHKFLFIKRKSATPSPQQLHLPNADKNDSPDDKKTVNVGKRVRFASSPKGVAPMSQKEIFKKRKELFRKRISACNLTLAFAFIGIAFTIVDAEYSASCVNFKTEKAEEDSYTSYFLRAVVVISTIVLLIVLAWYHALEIKMSVLDSGASDWRVVLTAGKLLQMILELMLCAVCPLPVTYMVDTIVLNDNQNNNNLTSPKLTSTSGPGSDIHTIKVPLNTLLSLPMFLRFYLIGRFMALRSGQFKDAATRSIARLNHVTVNFGFVLKTLMAEHPVKVLCTFTVVFWAVISWILVQCERHTGAPEQNHYLNAIWFTIITFMSVGYGDIVPNTYCGRAAAITTGIVGACVSSAIIAVMNLKLELSRAEKHVNNFMTDTKLSRQRKDAAANVLQQTWFIFKFKGLVNAQDEIKLRFHQRKFLAAINEFRRIKWEQRKIADQGNALVDVAKLQSDMRNILWDVQNNQDNMARQIQQLTNAVLEMHNTVMSERRGSASKTRLSPNVTTTASTTFVAKPIFSMDNLP